MSRRTAVLLLLAATTVWGVTFPLVKAALEGVGVFAFLALRFGLAALLLAPLARGLTRQGWRRAAACGVALFVGYSLQTWGLVWTTPARSAFVTALSVVLVPLLEPLLGLARASARVWGGALVAFAGLAVLLRPETGTVGPGELLTVGCAIAFAVHVLLLQWTVRVAAPAAATAVQVLVTAGLALPAASLEGWRVTPTATVIAAILVCALLATVFAFWAMTAVQRTLSASVTAVALAFEPVAAAIASVALGHEPTSAGLALGGAIVVSGVLLASVQPAEPGGAPAR